MTTKSRGGGAATGVGWVLAIAGCWSWSYGLTVLEPLARAGEIASGDAPGELVTGVSDVFRTASLADSHAAWLVYQSFSTSSGVRYPNAE